MKKLETFIVRTISNQTIMVPVGKTAQKFNGMITANSTAAFIWNYIEEVDSVEELAKIMCEEFEVSYEEAFDDIDTLIQHMKTAGWIE